MMKYSDRPNTYINAKDLEIAIVKATSYGDALDAVREAPSIDIIRCGECKYYEAKEDWCYWRDEAITADDFCSYGSRSEKPNNCEAKNYCDDCLYTDTCDSKEFFYACTSKATISKMEQVEDEPQTCSFSDCDNFKNPDYERCIECKRKQIKLKTEQTEREGE